MIQYIVNAPFSVIHLSDGSVRHKVERIFGIWLERNVYDQAFTDELVAILSK